MTSADIVVVGGGPAGLASALAAARRGFSVALFEAGPALGGMAASFEVAGQRVDYGSHRFHPAASTAVRRFVVDLLGEDLQQRERNGRLRLGDRWVRFPFRPRDMATSLPPAFALGAGFDALLGPFRRPDGDSYADVVRAGLGPTVLAGFHGPMATKLWGLPPERLSGELARRRISVRTPGALARRVARTSRTTGRTFFYPRLGYGQIVDRLADEAVAAGVELATLTPVTQVRPGPEPTVELADGRRWQAATVAWTAPATTLLDSRGAAGAARTHRGLVLAYLVLPVDRFTAFDAHYVPDPEVAFTRLSEPKNYRNGPDPRDRTVLCAELPCWPGDDRWLASVDEITELVLAGMAHSGLRPPEPSHVELRRLRSVYPVIGTENAGQRGVQLAALEQLEGVMAIGRQPRLVGDNLHHVMEMALEAMAALDDDATVNRSRWERAQSRFETFVVED